MTTTAIPLYVGYTWSIPVHLTGPDGTTPLDISTWTLAGDLWLPSQSLSQGTVLPAMDVNVSAASFRFVLSKTLTSSIPAQQPSASAYPCRIMVNYTDTTGAEFALRPIFILPLDPRSSAIWMQILGDIILADPVNLIVTTPSPVNLAVTQPSPVNLVVEAPSALVVVPAAQGPPGPQGEQGEKGDVGERGPSGAGSTIQVAFPQPLSIWTIVHNLGRFPSVTTVDTANDQMVGLLMYVDDASLQVTFSAPTAGIAYLN